MKLTKTANTKIKPGMTLIEITVVILVLLTLISVLFIGANIYKKGADRAACILNIRNVHQAVRAHQNLNGKNIGDTLVYADDIYAIGAVAAVPESSPGAGDAVPASPAVENYLTKPICPTASGDYSDNGDFPEVGIAAVTCDEYDATSGSVDTSFNHTPESTQGW